MPKRTDIHSILIIGAGPIVIGQACEFDYSGTQACKALKAEGYRIVLVNSNPATIMTDPDVADATYIEPITPEIVERIIERERAAHPSERMALLPTMGGQTALNTALALERKGVLARHGVEMIGARAEAINKAEDREQFKQAMARIGVETPRGETLQGMLREAVDERGNPILSDGKAILELTPEARSKALAIAQRLGFPVVIRPSFTLGGQGGGIAYNREEFLAIVERGVDASPTNEVLVEESVLGWKEYEMEVVRDRDDNCIIVCSIENVDPMGVHTGDSITVAPALTLTDKEYQIMRNASIAVLREIGVETGGSNVQFAVNPTDGRLVVIEMNPRVSRSSALASKATGFPIAKVAARLAVGYTLDELDNDITGGASPASFEPTIDYVVTKIPRFAFEKFRGADTTLTTSMKSVGEAMAIGRTFAESLQKALRSLETGLAGLDDIEFEGLGQGDDKNIIRAELGRPAPDRLLKVAQAMRHGMDDAQIHDCCGIDPWFLARIREIVETEERVRVHGLPDTRRQMLALKSMGISDPRLARLSGKSAAEVEALRRGLGVVPVYKRIDTCAAEFASPTAYMYATYEDGLDGAPACEAAPSAREKIVILGGGPNRIGQGIEFDYCCCHAAFSLSAAGYETIMVNCNPETVSTDYDTSDRLYFEPLTAEDVIEIIRKEQTNGTVKGVIVQFGGQTPLKLARPLEAAGITILGTSPDAIDLAEDRDRFAALVEKLQLRQPANGMASSIEQAAAIAARIGYPVVIRPSYVLGGRGMEIVHDDEELAHYMARAVAVSEGSPVLIDRYLRDAIEVDVDALADGREVFVAGVMEHIEEAGIHSGDSACSLPPHSLAPGMVEELKAQTVALARALGVTGLMNVQFAIKDGEIYLLEVNPRASRTVPFVAKVIGQPVAGIASRVMAGTPLATFGLVDRNLRHVAVKEAVFPFARFPGVDPILGPEMRSTGEVMGIDRDYAIAFAKSQLGSGTTLPASGTVFVSVKDSDKDGIVAPVRDLIEMGFEVVATRGTRRHLEAHGLACQHVNKVLEGRPHIVDAMKNRQIEMVFNTTEGSKAINDSKDIRRTALLYHIPYYTTLAGVLAVTRAIRALRSGQLSVAPLQSYVHSDAV
ncbi:MAG: carbamoyl-phosphate synthase large subunit [Rhizobiales bacterium]|nr:carbamoyl-phosphate synthase large subunit [Hyphomicrobiales bacterium]